jgi:hypothetical protein
MFITLTRWSMERMPVKRALGGFAAVLVMLALPSVASAQTAPTLSDTWQGAVTAEPNVHYVQPDTSGFTATGEPHTAGSTTNCKAGDGTGTATVEMEDTFWLKVEGTGGPITLSSVGSNFDTLVAVYLANQTPANGTRWFCNDDNRGDDVELTFNSQAGATYYTQWGGCAGCAGGSFGRAEFTILTNDRREFAAPAITRTRANWSATTVGGETQFCGPAQYGRTVWFRYVAPAAGTVTFAASRFDTVSALYRGNATTPFDCNDNDQGNILRSAVSGSVVPGEVLYLQVGGKGAANAAFEDNFSLDVTFAEDQDIDNDGYNKTPGPDCDDADA